MDVLPKNYVTPDEVRAAIATIPTERGKGPTVTASLLLTGTTIDMMAQQDLLKRLEQAGAKIEDMRAKRFRIDPLMLSEFHATDGKLNSERKRRQLARQTGLYTQAYKIEVPASLYHLLQQNSGVAWQIAPGDKSTLIRAAQPPAIATIYPAETLPVWGDMFAAARFVAGDDGIIIPVGSGVSGVVAADEHGEGEDDVDVMIAVDDIEAALRRLTRPFLSSAKPAGMETIQFYDSPDKVFLDTKTGLRYYKLEVAWDKDGYFDPTKPETKARQKAAFGKADFGIVQRETWGRRVSAHVFLRYMDKELHEKIIRDKQQFKKQADRMRADFAALGMDEKAFKASRVYKDWHDEYMTYKFRVNQDVERWVGMTEFKDFKDEHTLDLLENGVRLPAQQLLRNIGTVREYATKRLLDGNTEEILTVEDGDALVSMESAQRQFLVLPTKYQETRTKKDGTKPTEHEERLNPIALAQRRWMIWKVADRAGIRRNAGEFERSRYFEALLDMFDHPEGEGVPKAVIDTLDAVRKGQIDEARMHLRRLHPEWVMLNSVSDARAERISDVEIDDLLAEIVGKHASNDVIYQYHGNTRRDTGETPGMVREARAGNSRAGGSTTRENEGVESRTGQSGSADLLAGSPKWRATSQQRATPGQKVLSDAAASAGSLSTGRREITPEEKAEVERQISDALERLKDEGRIRDDGSVFAPNGKPSILHQSLLDLTGDEAIALRRYAMVHTQKFKDWFGDWENDPENSSKVVDENGEPMVVYHGSRSRFDAFDVGPEGAHFGSRSQAMMRNQGVIYTTPRRQHGYLEIIDQSLDAHLQIG